MLAEFLQTVDDVQRAGLVLMEQFVSKQFESQPFQ